MIEEDDLPIAYRAADVHLTALVIAIALSLLSGCQGQKGPALSKGSPLPAVSLPATDGRSLSIPGDIKGKLTVLLFWGQGCSYCRKEMPLIEPLYRKYRDRGFSFVAILIGPGMEASIDMKAEMGLSFPMAVDESGSLRKLYGIAAVPTMFVLDEQGNLRERVLGGLGARDLEKMIQEGL